MEFVMKCALIKLSSLFMFPVHLASCLSRSLEKKWKGRHLTIFDGTPDRHWADKRKQKHDWSKTVGTNNADVMRYYPTVFRM